MVWLVFAFMTVAAVLGVAWPLLRPRPAEEGGSDLAFYRQQMAELDGDAARGLLSPADIEGSRAELGRRLLAAAGRDAPVAAAAARPRRRTVAATVVLCFIPAAALGLYTRIGAPALPDLPLGDRLDRRNDIAQGVARLEAHLAAHPDDGRGFEVIALVYLRMGRYSDSVAAYADAMRLLGATPARRSAYGEALVLAAEGVVTAAARSSFETALSEDPHLPEARYYLGVTAEQDGDRERARSIWTTLVADAPADAPWLELVRRHLAALDAAAGPAEGAIPAVSGPDADNIAALPPDARMTAIRGMVDGLAARLAQNGHDPDGWLKLVRAYSVLGDADKARQALGDARRSLDGDAGALARLGTLAHELGLDG